MSKNYKTKYNYDHGNSLFIIYYKDQVFIGEAYCHTDDMDMESERTGLTIAEARALIKLRKFQRKYEIKPVVEAYRHTLKNIQSSTHHNPKAYESCMLRSQAAHWEAKLDEITADIEDEEKYLKEYIDQKDKLYRKLRARNQ